MMRFQNPRKGQVFLVTNREKTLLSKHCSGEACSRGLVQQDFCNIFFAGIYMSLASWLSDH